LKKACLCPVTLGFPRSFLIVCAIIKRYQVALDNVVAFHQTEDAMFRWFVWCRNPGKFLDDSGPGFSINAFLVATGTNFRWAVNINLQKLTIVKERSKLLAILPIRRNKCRKNYDASVHEELYHFADTADVSCSVFRPEGQVRA